MKKTLGLLIIFFATIIFLPATQAQKVQQSRWQRLETLTRAREAKQALALLDTLTDIVRKEHKRDLILKAAFFRLLLEKQRTDELPAYYMTYTDSLIRTAQGPVEKSLLSVMKARQLIALYRQSRSQINGRTSIKGSAIDESSPESWTKADYAQKIHELYTAALSAASALQKAPNRQYGALVDPAKTARLRPTVFDLLVWDAIDFYQSRELNLDSEMPYQLNDPEVMASAATFAAHEFPRPDGSDSLNADWLMLGYYQRLIRFHLKHKYTDKAALGDLDIARLQWAYDHSQDNLMASSGDKDPKAAKKAQYQQALRQAIKTYKGTDAALYGGYLLASKYCWSAETYQAAEGQGGQYRYDYQKALEIIQQFDQDLKAAQLKAADRENKHQLSRGAASLLTLRHKITAPHLNIQMDDYAVPGKSILALVQFKQLDKLYFRVLSTPNRVESVSLTDSVWQSLIASKPLHTFSQKLPRTGDFQQHSVEIKVPALRKGAYILLVSNSAAFNKDSLLGFISMNVTRLAFINHGADQFFVNRTTGQPISGVKAAVYESRWDNGQVHYLVDTVVVSNSQGQVTYGNNYLNKRLLASYKGDTITSKLYVYRPYTNRDAVKPLGKGQKEMLFYLDRSIYRPGQQVQFKGIATVRYPDKRGRMLLTGQKSYKIYLYKGRQKIDSVKLPINAFGALSGVFNLPLGQNTGMYHLAAAKMDAWQGQFKVEDYKRPTYFVTLDTLKQAVALGDSITISGQAMAYSGYPITDARVVIRVTRRVYFPYRWFGYLPPSSSAQIAHGTVQTDAKGNFQFTFLASGGSRDQLRFMPNYNFSVAASCTDLNGETRMANQQVVLGAQPFNISLDIPTQSSGDLLDTILLQTKTAAGRFTPQHVTLSITEVHPPDRLLRSKSWPAPDLSVMDSVDYVRDFPHDAFMHEAEKAHWKKGAVVLKTQLTTNAQGKLALHKNLKPGWYLVQATAPGKKGETIKDKQYVYLYNPQQPDFTGFYNWSEMGAASVVAGSTTAITLGSALQGQPVIYSVTRMGPGGQQVKYDQLVLNGQASRIPVRLTKEDIHGAQIDYSFVRDNRMYTGSLKVRLKDTTTPPSIVYESYRDKTLPGSKEHWRLHIDKAGRRIKNMELLSAMYDASLDQFAPHSWQIATKEGSGFLQAENWNSAGSFGTGALSVHRKVEPRYTYETAYDHLIFKDWFASSSRSTRMGPIMLRGVARGLAAPEAQSDKVVVAYGKKVTNEKALSADANDAAPANTAMQPVRHDFRETAFFFPTIQSDAMGNYTIDFQMPDALTTWKWMNLAYDKDLNMVYSTKKIVSQKTLMVSPNMPRFVRNGDQLTLSTKVINLSQQDLECAVSITLMDPATGKTLHWQPKDGSIVDKGQGASIVTAVGAGSNTTVRFDLIVPEDFTGPVDIIIKAKGGQFSDAEKNVLPVITNKILVTETQPIYMDGDGKASFQMDKLLALGRNKAHPNQENKKLVFELTTNPIWNVVLALPEVQLGKNPGGMDVLNRLYAEAMGNYIIGKYPVITRVIRSWSKDTSKAANDQPLLSALAKNPDLKSVLLQQTPWVMQAQDETQRHLALVRFFDKNKMEAMQQTLIGQLQGLQKADGGFSWFSGGHADALSTQWILSGIYQLTNGKLKSASLTTTLATIGHSASRYLNNYYQMRYAKWQQSVKTDRKKIEDNKGDLTKLDTSYPVTSQEIHYLYTLSLNGDPGNLNEMQVQFLQAEKNNWQQRSIYLQLLIAATHYRMGDKSFAINTVLNSALDKTVLKAELGRYWKTAPGYDNWAASPLRAQALAISLLTEVAPSPYGYGQHPAWKDYLNELQRYLIGQKQLNHWPAARTTIDACMAIIEATPGALHADRKVAVQIGHLKPDLKATAGAGYMRYELAGKDITADMGKVTIELKGAGKNSAVPVYGGLYWQYISPIKAVEAAKKSSGISLDKALFKQINTTSGQQLVAVKSGDILAVGDQLVSRLVIRIDRDMDYLHLREMRPAGVQPDQNISRYQYQDGLAYYQAIGDMSTDLYFDHINKGTYVIEYPVHVSHAGSFAAGTATMESFYAPTFATHTEGIRIQATQAK